MRDHLLFAANRDATIHVRDQAPARRLAGFYIRTGLDVGGAEAFSLRPIPTSCHLVHTAARPGSVDSRKVGIEDLASVSDNDSFPRDIVIVACHRAVRRSWSDRSDVHLHPLLAMPHLFLICREGTVALTEISQNQRGEITLFCLDRDDHDLL